MIFPIFYLLSAVETYLIGFYLAAVGSSAQESLFFNLTSSRLLIVVFFFLLGCGFIYLAVRSLNPDGKSAIKQRKYLSDESSQWRTFFLALLGIGLALFLLTRQLNSLGDLKQIYQRFEPALVWAAVLSAQAAFFTAVWYFAHFVSNKEQREIDATQKELLPLIGLYFGFVIVKLIFISGTSFGPIGRGDEMTYFDMADSFYRGFFSVAQSNHYPPLYPLSIMISLVFKSLTFDGIKLLNALYSSSILFPVYFITRRFLDAPRSLATAFVSCLIPYHLVFPRRILSENLFFPLFLWTMAITYSLPRSKAFRIQWDLLNGAMLAALYLTRYITLALIPFFILAWWMKPFEGEKSLFKPGWKKILYFGFMITAMLAVFSPWLAGGLSEKVPLKFILGFGITARTTPEQLTLPKLLIWVALYACYFILIAAPVLNLLITSLFQIDFKRWRDGFSRWVLQVLVIMGGFYAAVARHSWRAYYNADMPVIIMGRYLIVFSVVYFVIASITLTHFKKTLFRSKGQFITYSLLLPIGLVSISYFILIKGMLIQTDGDLLNSLGSVDAFFTEILGGYFLVLLFLIYAVINWLLWKGMNMKAMTALIISLVVYYVIGMPSYTQNILDFQTYPWLSSRIAKLAPQPDLKSGDSEEITVFMPEVSDSKNKAEIYNGLRLRGINGTHIEAFSQESVDTMVTDNGYIIKAVNSDAENTTGFPTLEFNQQFFVIIPVRK